ncbi:UDP-2,4-diacetamido-2,4,6-trideoxy-beta-L-altropyranose hydrolase [Leucobacter sp. GX24907]
MNGASARVMIRADAGSDVGLGHLVRCLSLADQLVRSGAEVTLAIRYPNDEVAARAQRAGVELRAMTTDHGSATDRGVLHAKTQLRDAREAFGAEEPARVHDADAEHLEASPAWDAVVVDHYRLDAAWEHEAHRHARRVVVIDDLANRPHIADVLIDHNWYGDGTATRYRGLVGVGTLQLLGPRYALLDPAYAKQCPLREAVQIPPRRVLIGFGGTDAATQTERAVRAVLACTDLQVDIVVGAHDRVSDELRNLVDGDERASLHVAVPNLAELLARADLAIGASGSATWERLCMRVPALVTTVSEEQSGVTRALAAAGACAWLGIADALHPDDYERAITAAAEGAVPEAPAIVDGFGSARAALAILGVDQRSADASEADVRETVAGTTVTGELVVRAARADDEASYVSALAAQDANAGPAAWREAAAEFFRLLEKHGGVEVVEFGGIPVGIRVQADGERPRCITDGYLREGVRR